FDKTVGPNLLHQLFFGEHVAGVFEQDLQCIEHFGRKRHLSILFEEHALAHVHSKSIKQIKAFGWPIHHGFQNFLKKISAAIQRALNTTTRSSRYFPPTLTKHPTNSGGDYLGGMR